MERRKVRAGVRLAEQTRRGGLGTTEERADERGVEVQAREVVTSHQRAAVHLCRRGHVGAGVARFSMSAARCREGFQEALATKTWWRARRFLGPLFTSTAACPFKRHGCAPRPPRALSAHAIAVATARRFYRDPASPPLGPYRYIPRPDSEQPRLVQAWDAARAAREASGDVLAEEAGDAFAEEAVDPPPPAPSSSSSSAAAAPSRKRRRARDASENDGAAPPRSAPSASMLECEECGYTSHRKNDVLRHTHPRYRPPRRAPPRLR